MNLFRPLLAVLLLAPLTGFAQNNSSASAADIVFRETADRLVFTAGNRPIGEYVFRDAAILRPYLANLHAPDGTRVTRHHPPVPGVDATDHDTMHPGIWLAFGDINGQDFWRNRGRIIHRKFIKPPQVRDGSLAFTTESDMVSADGKSLARMVNALTISGRSNAWQITWEATFHPGTEGFYFGDQEEMGLGVRVATGITELQGGKITNSTGATTAKGTWGKPAAWCDYSGIIAGRHVGVLVIPDPANPHPSWWHNRDYGVFVSNPFGKNALKQGAPSRIAVKQGDSYRLRHTIILHTSTQAGDPADLLKLK